MGEVQSANQRAVEAESRTTIHSEQLEATKRQIETRETECQQLRTQMMHQKDISQQYQDINSQMQVENLRCREQMQTLNTALAAERAQRAEVQDEATMQTERADRSRLRMSG